MSRYADKINQNKQAISITSYDLLMTPRGITNQNNQEQGTETLRQTPGQNLNSKQCRKPENKK